MDITPANSQHFQKIVEFNRKEYWDFDIFQNLSNTEKFDLGRWWVELPWLKWHSHVLSQCNGKILLAIENGKIIGQLDYIISPNHFQGAFINHAHIVWLLVDKSERKKRIASKLIDYLLQIHPKIEIWVDPEDHRSEGLYQKYSNPFSYFINYEKRLSSPKLHSDNIKKKSFPYATLIQKIRAGDVILQVGRYYGPLFDILQLDIGEPVKDLIWGDFGKPPIVEYSMNDITIICVMTQFVRIFSLGPIMPDQFAHFLPILMHDLYKLGYEFVTIQIYIDDPLSRLFQELGFPPISDLDPIFNLQSQ